MCVCVCLYVCVRECVYVCVCARGTAGAARPSPSATATVTAAPTAGRALHCSPGLAAAARSRPEGTAAAPHTPSLTRPRLEGPRSSTARFVQTMEDVTHSARAPRVAVDSQAAGSPRWPPPPRCPLDSVPKGVEIRPVFSAPWPLEGVSSGLRTAENQGRRVGGYQNQEWSVLPALGLGLTVLSFSELVRCRNR